MSKEVALARFEIDGPSRFQKIVDDRNCRQLLQVPVTRIEAAAVQSGGGFEPHPLKIEATRSISLGVQPI